MNPVGASAAAIDAVEVSAFTVPTDGPHGREGDGTLTWNSTTVVVVELRAGIPSIGIEPSCVATFRHELTDNGPAHRPPCAPNAPQRYSGHGGAEDCDGDSARSPHLQTSAVSTPWVATKTRDQLGSR